MTQAGRVVMEADFPIPEGEEELEADVSGVPSRVCYSGEGGGWLYESHVRGQPLSEGCDSLTDS